MDYNDCKVHKGKPLDYFCKNCDKAICVDCTIVGGEKSCQKHEVVTMQEMVSIKDVFAQNWSEDLISVIFSGY